MLNIVLITMHLFYLEVNVKPTNITTTATPGRWGYISVTVGVCFNYGYGYEIYYKSYKIY